MAREYAIFSPDNQLAAWKEFGVGRTMYGVRHHVKGNEYANAGGYWATKDCYPIEALMESLPANPKKPEVWIYIREV